LLAEVTILTKELALRVIDQEYLQRPERVHLGAQVDRELAVELARLARANSRSTSAELRRAVAAHLERERTAA
jgi:hypothetical protein